MPQDYFSLVTNQGLIKEAASDEPGGTSINLTEMAVGDSNGSYYDPDGSEIALVNEVHRVNLTHVVVDENNTNQLIVEAVLDETIGPFYVREVGIFDSNGDLFAIGKYPETFKPNLPAGSGKRLYIRMILGFANSPNVNLIINNDIALDPNFGTDVNNALAERLIKTNNLLDLESIEASRNNLEVYSKDYLNSKVGKNYIINGNFDIWQRGLSFDQTHSYGPDRWKIWNSGATVLFTRQSFAVGQDDVPSNPKYYININCTVANNGAGLIQCIEGVRTLANKTVTISFWAKADSNRTLYTRLDQSFGSGGSADVLGVDTKNHAATTSWQKFTHTLIIPSIFGKLIGVNDHISLVLVNPNNEIFSLDIAQVQLEEGNIATNFEYKHIKEELSLCQRYYEKSYDIDTPPGSAAGSAMWLNGTYADPYLAMTSIQFKVEKRSTPAVIIYSPSSAINSVQSYSGDLNVSSINDVGTHGIGRVYTSNTSSPVSDSWRACHYAADSEL